jgi:hypothetical protein
MITSSGCVRHKHTRWKCRYITVTYNEIHHRVLHGEDQSKAGRHCYSHEDSGKFRERRVWRVGNQWTFSLCISCKIRRMYAWRLLPMEWDAVNQSCAYRMLPAGCLLGSTLKMEAVRSSEMSLPSQILGLCVRIPLEAWMSAFILCLCCPA